MIRRRRKPGQRPEVPPVPAITTYADALACLRTLGFEPGTCPALCRRKGEHQHMRHGSGVAEVIVSPGQQ
jgi:hypothetical protein